MLRSILIVFTLLTTQLLFPQTDYQIDWYSADNNYLPQNSVKSIIEDKYGFMWLSTEDGLVRYDGQDFRVYNTSNVLNLGSARMMQFWGSATRDSLFIKTEKNELILIHNRQIKKLRQKEHLPISLHKPFYTFYEEGVFGRHFSSKNEFFKILGSHTYYIIGNDSIRHYSINDKLLTTVAYRYPEKSQFFAVEDKLYLLEDKNIYCEFSSGTFRKKKFDKSFNDDIVIYTNPVAHQSFVYSDHKLFILNVSNGKLTPELVLDGFDFPANNIVSVYFNAPHKILYAGSYNKGLAVIKPRNYKTSTNTSSDGVYYALVPFGKDNVMTSTGDIFNNSGYAGSLNFREETDKYMLAIDDSGNIWTKKHWKLVCYTKSSGYKKFISWALPDRISTIAKDWSGKIWIATQSTRSSGELFYINTRQSNPTPVFFHKIPYAVNCMAFYDKQKMFLGSEKGLHFVNLHTKKTGDVYSATNAYVRSIYIRSADEIWATTYSSGFFLYKNGKIIHFPLDRNKFLLSSHCMAEDKNGFFWIPTNKGLFQILRKDLLDYADQKKKTLFFYYYDRSTGFLSNEFNGGCQPCAAIQNNMIYLPSMNGVVHFNPNDVIPSLPSSHLYIDEAEVDGKLVRVNKTISLSRDFHRIKFLISSPYYGNSYNQNIEFSLEGPLHQHWTAVTDNQIIFSTLPPGKYILKVRKQTGFGSRYSHRNILINIPLPFWQTGWFYVCMVLMFGAVVIVISSLRVKYIKYRNLILEKEIALQTTQLHETIRTLKRTKDDLDKQVKVHKKLVKTVTHDIKSPLRFMTLTSRYLYNNPEKDIIMREGVESIYTSAQQLYNFVDNFLENAKKNEVNPESEPYLLHSLVEEKIAFFNNIARSKDTSLLNSVPTDLVTTTNNHLLSIILHNLLDNAIKNTTGGSIVYSAGTENNQMYIILKDTGKGMSLEQVNYYMGLLRNNNEGVERTTHGMGLHTVIDLLIILGGNLEILSSALTGTRITIIFPSLSNHRGIS